MLLSTPLLRCVGVLWALLCFGLAAQAQPTPTWSSVTRLGTSTLSTSAVVIDAAGNSYEVGTFSDAIEVGRTRLNSQGGLDAYLAKYTPAGALAWVRQLGAEDNDVAMDVALDAAGNVYVSGSFVHTIALGNKVVLEDGTGPFYGQKAFVIRYSPQGAPEWAQQSSVSTSGYVNASSLSVDGVGNVYMVGSFTSTLTLESSTITNVSNEFSNYLVRLSAATGRVLALQLANRYVPTTSASYSYPEVAAVPTGGAYLLLAFRQQPIFGTTTLTSRGSSDGVVVKYSPQGSLEWLQQFGGTGNDGVSDGVVDAAGNLYMTGGFSETVRFDNHTLSGAGGNDGFLAKYSPKGTVQWVQTGGGPSQDYFASVALDAAGSPYVVGSFSAGAQLSSRTLSNAGNIDVAIAAYSPLGELRWVQQAGGAAADFGFFLGVDMSGSVYVRGTYGPTCTFGMLPLSTVDPSETYLALLTGNVLTTREKTAFAAPTALYPNPATSLVHVVGLSAGSPVQLLDAGGRIARTAVLSTDATINIQGVAPGLYTLRATDTQGRAYTRRLVVQ
ncbi:MAG TPA: T9SS type A sorting domain-containing protein [Hymenobacter sp.]|jgi:hypothetical protein